MADYAELMNLEKKQKGQTPQPQEEKRQSSHQSIAQPTSKSIAKSSRRLTNQAVRQLYTSGNRVLDKPKAFYITERLNQRLDEAVRYYQEKHNIKKVDRSVIVTAILDNEANWTEEALDLLVDKVINQLTSRLMG